MGVGADLRYLTGYEAMPLERLTMLVLPAMESAPATLIAPRLEVTPARGCAAARAGTVEIATWEETEDPMALVASRLAAATRGRADEVAAVAVSDGLRAAFVLGLQRVLPGARFSLTSSVLRALRMRKDPDEIALLRAAGAAADRVVLADRATAGSSAAPRPTSRARSGSGSSPRATTAPTSRSSPPGPTAPPRTTTRATA